MRIFVSSTSLDLRAYRDSVIAAILRLGHTPVAMEFYSAQASRPVDRCLEDVASCDVYVGIFAHRYGCIPEGYDRSISELEYRKAVEEGVPAMVFLVDETVPWPDEHTDRGEAGARIRAFREELQASTLVSFFKSPDDLCARVTASIALSPVRPLHTGIVGVCPADVTSRFKDREDKIAELRGLLGEKTLKLICIVGRGGVGKTWLLSKLCSEIERGDLRLSSAAARMGAEGIVYLSCRAQNRSMAETIFHSLSQLLGKVESQALYSRWNDVSLSTSEKMRSLLAALQEGCYLLVLDNFGGSANLR